MSNKNTIPKEYAIIASLIIFFTIVILVGTIRVIKATKENLDKVDLAKIDVIENSSSMDLKSINLKIKNAIQKQYDVDIFYGDGVSLESVNAVAITDNDEIFAMLKELNAVLSKYPIGLVKEIESKGYTVSVYLVDYFKSDMVALANRNSIGQFKIYISDTDDVERALHHECYHILDYYIKLQTNETETYKMWKTYNPKNFTYIENVDNITTEYVYYGKPGAYFVTPYAKYSEKEDRAETFAEMLTADRTETFFDDGEKIKSKIDLLKGVLKNTFNSVKKEKNLAWN